MSSPCSRRWWDWCLRQNIPITNNKLSMGAVPSHTRPCVRAWGFRSFPVTASSGTARYSRAKNLGGTQTGHRFDAVDWVERIPFAETRNYVQRVMENLQIYRARFNADTAITEPGVHARVESRAKPALVDSIPR